MIVDVHFVEIAHSTRMKWYQRFVGNPNGKPVIGV